MHSPRRFFAVATISYLATLAAIVVAGLRMNSGVLVFALDDPYIHLSVAHNLVAHGTYGVTANAYESASSAPAWTLLLAGFAAVGASSVWIPLVLNVAAGLWILWTMSTHQKLVVWRAGRLESWLAAMLLPLGLFLPGLAITGMEHTLHAALTLNLLLWLGRLLGSDTETVRPAHYYGLLLIAPLIRFEALFVTIGCAAALLLRRMPWRAALTLLAGAAPVAVYGSINLLHGQFFLPNSVVAKSRVESGVSNWFPSATQLVNSLSHDPMLAALLIVMLVVAAMLWQRGDSSRSALCIAVLITASLHFAFAAVGWFERYQAYLIIGASFVLLRVAGETLPPTRRGLVVAVVLLSLVVLPGRRWLLMMYAPLACHNIYSQDYQLAVFLKEHYQNRGVLVNDIGLVSLFHEGPLLDIWGLGSHEILRDRISDRSSRHNYAADEARAHGVDIAAVYEIVMGPTPNGWTKTAAWDIGATWWNPRLAWLPVDLPPAWSGLTFYARSPEASRELAANLRAFQSQLPTGEFVTYFP